MVSEWDQGLQDDELLYSRYYEQCQPFDCFYEEKAKTGLLDTVLVILGLVGLSVGMIQSGLDKIIDGVTIVLCKVKKVDVHGMEDTIIGEFHSLNGHKKQYRAHIQWREVKATAKMAGTAFGVGPLRGEDDTPGQRAGSKGAVVGVATPGGAGEGAAVVRGMPVADSHIVEAFEAPSEHTQVVEFDEWGGYEASEASAHTASPSSTKLGKGRGAIHITGEDSHVPPASKSTMSRYGAGSGAGSNAAGPVHPAVRANLSLESLMAGQGGALLYPRHPLPGARSVSPSAALRGHSSPMVSPQKLDSQAAALNKKLESMFDAPATSVATIDFDSLWGEVEDVGDSRGLMSEPTC
jgi:hypothetical protein